MTSKANVVLDDDKDIIIELLGRIRRFTHSDGVVGDVLASDILAEALDLIEHDLVKWFDMAKDLKTNPETGENFISGPIMRRMPNYCSLLWDRESQDDSCIGYLIDESLINDSCKKTKSYIRSVLCLEAGVTFAVAFKPKAKNYPAKKRSSPYQSKKQAAKAARATDRMTAPSTSYDVDAGRNGNTIYNVNAAQHVNAAPDANVTRHANASHQFNAGYQANAAAVDNAVSVANTVSVVNTVYGTYTANGANGAYVANAGGHYANVGQRATKAAKRKRGRPPKYPATGTLFSYDYPDSRVAQAIFNGPLASNGNLTTPQQPGSMPRFGPPHTDPNLLAEMASATNAAEGRAMTPQHLVPVPWTANPPVTDQALLRPDQEWVFNPQPMMPFAAPQANHDWPRPAANSHSPSMASAHITPGEQHLLNLSMNRWPPQRRGDDHVEHILRSPDPQHPPNNE